MRCSSTSSGNAPASSTWSWKARMSNFAPKRFLRAVAQLQNLHLPDLVGQRLARPSNVAVHLGLHAGLIHVRVLVEVLDHLVAGPALGVDAGIDHQADGAPDVGFQAAVVGVGVLVEANVLAQPLGVERPSLRVGRVARRICGTPARPSAPARWRSAGDGRECPRDRRSTSTAYRLRSVALYVLMNKRPGRLPSGVPGS